MSHSHWFTFQGKFRDCAVYFSDLKLSPDATVIITKQFDTQKAMQMSEPTLLKLYKPLFEEVADLWLIIGYCIQFILDTRNEIVGLFSHM